MHGNWDAAGAQLFGGPSTGRAHQPGTQPSAADRHSMRADGHMGGWLVGIGRGRGTGAVCRRGKTPVS